MNKNKVKLKIVNVESVTIIDYISFPELMEALRAATSPESIGDSIAVEVYAPGNKHAIVIDDCDTINAEFHHSQLELDNIIVEKIDYTDDYYSDNFDDEEDEIIKKGLRIYLKTPYQELLKIINESENIE